MPGQLTLGEVIEKLKTMNPDLEISLKNPHSYLGYSNCLSLEPEVNSVGNLLRECEKVLGAYLTGYKGGEFLMTKYTPVYVSFEGSCSGDELFMIHDNGQYTSLCKEFKNGFNL